jgi:hypothetical protein
MARQAQELRPVSIGIAPVFLSIVYRAVFECSCTRQELQLPVCLGNVWILIDFGKQERRAYG